MRASVGIDFLKNCSYKVCISRIKTNMHAIWPIGKVTPLKVKPLSKPNLIPDEGAQPSSPQIRPTIKAYSPS
jgi:hypothetical protein